jgi:hypothetical protein
MISWILGLGQDVAFHFKVFKGYPKKKEKEKASELSLRICLWVVLSTPSYQNCVESFLPRYCFSIW